MESFFLIPRKIIPDADEDYELYCSQSILNNKIINNTLK